MGLPKILEKLVLIGENCNDNGLARLAEVQS